jgi:hypothetical protein
MAHVPEPHPRSSRKADFVPVDVSKFTAEQITRIKEFIEPLESRVFW